MSDFDNRKKSGGDDGSSGLLDGTRVSKDDLVFAALGDIDELSSILGLTKAVIRDDASAGEPAVGLLEEIQSDLVRIGAQIAMPENNPRYDTLDTIIPADVAKIDKFVKTYTAKVELPKEFILPGGTVTGAQVDIARAVCRRAERAVVSCIARKNMSRLDDCQSYLNRLSELLFILARWLENATG